MIPERRGRRICRSFQSPLSGFRDLCLIAMRRNIPCIGFLGIENPPRVAENGRIPVIGFLWIRTRDLVIGKLKMKMRSYHHFPSSGFRQSLKEKGTRR
uniref:Uncharacterized protein n=1 Tax=Picea sitchensis TaxID=3332 RepID=A9NW49_PICSI|nr:unknown [Picea sitchensis]